MMTNELKRFITDTNQVILDSELLILLLAGLYDTKSIKKIHSTKKFSEKNFEDLLLILNNFKKIKTTSHIITEFSNLNKHKHYRKELFKEFKEKIKSNYLDEEFMDVEELITDNDFSRLGVADIGIKNISKKNIVHYSKILTNNHFLILMKNSIKML